jgi:neural Wiskott-Aldrich syndrome protein
VVRRGLRLRNVRAELVRVVKVKREYSEDVETDSDSDIAPDESSNIQGGSSLGASQQPLDSSKMPLSPLFLGSSYRAIIARSGASCRFHFSRPIQLRFILHQNSAGSPSDSLSNLSCVDSDTESPLITQSTILHSVTFHIKVHISFVDTSNQTERISTIVVPITILPPLAPLPQVSQAMDDAYQKKHDRPPAKTTREEETDPSIPYYSEAGPSMLSSGSPPPFEERDAPPPFFVSAVEASSSSRLPTFQESETEIILPETGDLMNEVPFSCSILGEGTLFGFPSSQQFDGHSEDIQQSSTPPPTLEMASGDTDLTALADQPNHVSMEVMNLVLDQRAEDPRVEEQPPPPPAMDDPSDPPPSIDSDFRSPVVVGQTSSSRASPPLRPAYHQSDTGLHISTPVLASEEIRSSHGHAPPPYLTDIHRENESDQVTRPPPYVD